MEAIRRCLFGPRLFRIPKGDARILSKEYEANMIESGSDKCIKVFHFCWSLSFWISPILFPYLLKKGLLTSLEGLGTTFRLGLSLAVVYSFVFFVRGLGRYTNTDYVTFTTILAAAQKSLTQQNKRLLHRYDCEMWAWPVEFYLPSDCSVLPKRNKVFTKTSNVSYSFTSLPLHALSYLAIHTFGRRLVYPGTTALMNNLVGPSLRQSRKKLIEEKNGQRAKLRTVDKNDLDTMFIDRRNEGGNGDTLVICFEGNAGFYEIGCCGTPTDLGYSVLGFNRPGFAESTGIPFPDQEQNAVDTVMQYAIQKLGFLPENICLFAWSIGGYGASWAAMNYPDVQQVILDATFDDIIPLAETKMPEAWKSLVSFTLKKYMHLDVAGQLTKYNGPIRLIRRSKDEIISTETVPGLPPNISTNRGNLLLKQILIHRYPKLMTETRRSLLDDWLAGESSHQELMFMEHRVDSSFCKASLMSYVEEHSNSYPMDIGEGLTEPQKNQLALYLASKYMQDFDSTHCTPLPTSFFHKAWSPSD